MFRIRLRRSISATGFPHARGDVPAEAACHVPEHGFSPRPWGCSGTSSDDDVFGYVFPTPVGMSRAYFRRPRRGRSFPHARGDVPYSLFTKISKFGFSPRPWGCSCQSVAGCWQWSVFPTPVGMFRADFAAPMPNLRFPHACGDVPRNSAIKVSNGAFSPRLWGCS